MEKIIKNKAFSTEDFDTLIAIMKKYGGQTYTEKVAQKYVKNAKNALETFKHSTTKEILLTIADYTLARKV
jgi:geranylgeranyl pyrophosphate synthase